MNAAPPDFPDHVDETVRSIARLHADHHGRASAPQRIVSELTAIVGRPAFVVVMAVAIGAWMGLNLLMVGLGYPAIDLPAFQWLQGGMTLVSLFLVVLILGAQKHEDELNAHREMLALELAILNEQKTAKVIRLLEELRRDSPQIQDRIDREAEAMARPADPQTVLAAIKESRATPAEPPPPRR